jgi:hypothetical protein
VASRTNSSCGMIRASRSGYHRRCFKGHDFPKGVHLCHKFDQQVMELGFSGRNVEEILAAKSDWSDDIVPVQKRGTASLAVRVPPINMNLGIEPQLSAVEGSLSAHAFCEPPEIAFSGRLLTVNLGSRDRAPGWAHITMRSISSWVSRSLVRS